MLIVLISLTFSGIVGHAQHNGSSSAAVAGSTLASSPDNAERTHEAGQSAGASQSNDDGLMANAGCSGIHERWGAPHAEGEMPQPRRMGGDGLSVRIGAEAEALADAKRQRLSGQGESESSRRTAPSRQGEAAWLEHGRVGEQWSIEPDVGRVANGIPNRVERLRALGNAVVPQIPFLIGQAILRYEQEMS